MTIGTAMSAVTILFAIYFFLGLCLRAGKKQNTYMLVTMICWVVAMVGLAVLPLLGPEP
jgi:hypothetical protein